MTKPLNKKRFFFLAFVLLLLFLFWFSSPKVLFNDPYSTVVESSDGRLLSARIASDGQWRFPSSDSVHYKYQQAVTHFEDEYFFYHFGVNPVSIIRAFYQNLFSTKVVSGGSTITMQLIRLSRKGKPRTYKEKIIEIILAIRIELSYSKDEILNAYASHAPFGGNVVGLEAASWRYYGRSSDLLSWGEIATLAVLPNAPSLIYPGKNQKRLLLKRNRLLDKLAFNEIISLEDCNLAKDEPLPQKPLPLPQKALHLINRVAKEGNSNRVVRSSIDSDLQLALNDLIDLYHQRLALNEIQNASILVFDVQKAKVVSYIGNTKCTSEDCGSNVDIIESRRSTGSTLKPFLFISMLENGTLLPDALLEDVPTKISGYSPQNFFRSFDGAVSASDALIRSLNIPAVRLLQNYGVPEFHKRLKELGFTTIDKKPSHYGLSLILGGAECKLWELCSAYYYLTRKLTNQTLEKPSYLKDVEPTSEIDLRNFSKASIYQTYQILSQVNRPVEQGAWKIFDSSREIAWKTGTSFGQRDAWSIGVTPEYVVGVWVGNADGEGRPGLTGIQMAAPLMFDAFEKLPNTSWFSSPSKELFPIEVCVKSGFRKSDLCPETKFINSSEMGVYFPTCSFHKKIHLDQQLKNRVNSKCYSIDEMVEKVWFTLPPLQERYYRLNHPDYKKLPDIHPECIEENEKVMDLIYPTDGLKIFVPKDLNGEISASIFELAHKNPKAEIYWYMDQDFLGKTVGSHKKEIVANEGKHEFVFIDQFGNTFERKIEFIFR